MANWLNTAFFGLDRAVFVFANKLFVQCGKVLTPIFNFITTLGNGGWAFIVCGVLLLLFRKTRKIGLGVLLSLLVGSILTNIAIKNIVARPRPYLASEEYKVFWQASCGVVQSEFSFPSGHTTVSMAFATAIFLSCNKKWSWCAFILTLVMGLTRIYFVVHYFTDIIGGILVGGIAGVCGYFLNKYIYSQIENNPDKKFCWFVLNADIKNIFKKK